MVGVAGRAKVRGLPIYFIIASVIANMRDASMRE